MDVYLALFLTAFLSATLLPGASEVAVVALMHEQYDVWLLWGFATAGNTLGAVVNFYMGRYLVHFQDKRWFPFKKESLYRSQQWFKRYGTWSLLFAWMPLVGDGLTFIAGMMKIHFVLFLLLVGIGKGVRYAVVLGLFGLMNHFFIV